VRYDTRAYHLNNMNQKSQNNLQQYTLANGIKIPSLGIGTWKIRDGREVIRTIRTSLDAGYRLIDTAKIYGNEKGVGKAIRECGIPREQIFVTTKLWNKDQGYEKAHKAFEKSLKTLGLEYVDLFLIHWPVAAARLESWKALVDIAASGKCRAIGVSNYTIPHLQELMNNFDVLPVVNQVEFHPFLYQKDLLDFCVQHNIRLEAYSPLAHGEKLSDPRITVIAKKYEKSNAQILIRWSLQHGLVVIPKSTHSQRIIENIAVYDFLLSEEDMAALDSLNENLRTCWDPTDF